MECYSQAFRSEKFSDRSDMYVNDENFTGNGM